jgi:hypothetical protein
MCSNILRIIAPEGIPEQGRKKLISRPTRWSCLLTDHIQIHLDRHLYIGSVTETRGCPMKPWPVSTEAMSRKAVREGGLTMVRDGERLRRPILRSTT